MVFSTSTTPRSGFIGALAAGAAGLAATWLPERAAAAAESAALLPPSDEWLSRIKGKHKQVFDAVTPNDGWGPAFALNYLDSTAQALKLGDKDLSAVVVLRHWAMPLTLTDDVWAKYKIGELIGVTDPKTSAPATRNIFSANVPLRPGLTYEQAITNRGVILVACNLALTVLSEKAAPKAGVTAAQARKEWEAGLIKGVALAASGVYAVNRAQEAGCTYCYAG
jgi:hypothetical protein